MSEAPSLPRPAPFPARVSAFFWEGVDADELRVQRCSDCGELRFPPRPMCPDCHAVAWNTETLSGEGRVYSWIRPVHPRLPMFAEDTIVALIDLAPGVRLVSNLCDVALEDVEKDMPVEVFFIDLGEGRRLHQFRPRSERSGG